MSEPLSDHRATVNLCFDFDAVSIWMAWGARGVRTLSRGEFGAKVGAPRILDILDRYGITSTWFIPGHTADTYPHITAKVAEQGHEIGNHGYLHEAFDKRTHDEVRQIIRKGNEALQRVTGQRPRGLRAPAGDFDGHLFEMLVEEGFDYDSSCFDGEFDLCWARGEGTIREDGPNIPGEPLDLVEVPLSMVMQDFIYFEPNYAEPQLTGAAPPSHVEEIWLAQFDYMYERAPGGILTVTMHPQSIGWGLRSLVLERFIEHVLEQPGTRFATCGAVADEFRSQQGGSVVAAGRPESRIP
jgi:peptidoglycan/xylan/chitin deacetylase (PgdA/CDA1 family)